jgi:hypothetical protein
MEKFLDRAGGNPRVNTEENRIQPATNTKASSPVLGKNLHGGRPNLDGQRIREAKAKIELS